MLDDYVREKVMNTWNVIIEVRMLRKLYKLHDTLALEEAPLCMSDFLRFAGEFCPY